MTLSDDRQVLVTGGCGFIGANLVPVLEKRGYRVRVLDDLSRGRAEYLSDTDAEIVRGDIRDRESVYNAFDGVRYVVHLAAYGSVVESVDSPFTNFDVNGAGTLNVLSAAAAADVDKFVFASTGGAVIGNAEPPVDETCVPKPISPYGASKLTGEAYCSAFGASYELNTVMLRFANVYGPLSAHKKGAVTTFAKALLKGDPIRIYGDGSASRDFLHVNDLVRGIVSALSADLEPATIIHISSGEETRVDDLARYMAAIAGRPDHPVEFVNRRPGEVARNFAQYARAKKLLDFEPSITFSEGLKGTWEWFLANQEAVLATDESDS